MTFMELMATLGLDSSEYESGLNRAQGMLSSAGGAIATGLGAIAGATTAAIGATAAGVVNLTTQAVNAYGSYEQLVGGVNKIFGESSDAVMEYASRAYETAGLSANQYMETITSFSASLLQGLEGDTAMAAELADQAIRDMSDNANTFGTDIQSIQNAYMGFSKGNFTMLDNLKLGYGGTQSEMIRLINDSHILEEEIDSLDNITFDQMIEAIHAVQTEMNITDTTANEAAGTIQGSMGALQAAWQNLVIGLGNADADLGALIDDVVTQAVGVVTNMVPIIRQAMEGIATLITEVVPIIEQELPSLIEEVLPPLLDAVLAIVTAIADALPTIMEVLTEQLPPVIERVVPVIMRLIPMLISVGGEILGAVVRGLIENAHTIIDSVFDIMQLIVSSFSDAVSGDGASGLAETAMYFIQKLGEFLVENIPLLVNATMSVIHFLVDYLLTDDNLTMLITTATQIILVLTEALIEAAPELIGAVVVLLSNILVALAQSLPIIAEQVADFLDGLVNAVGDGLFNLFGTGLIEVGNGLASWWDSVVEWGANAMVGAADFIGDMLLSISNFWTDTFGSFEDGIASVGDALAGWWDELVTWFGNLADSALEWAGDMVSNFVSGITNGISSIGDAVGGIADTVASYIHFSEPEIGPLSNFHTFAPDMVQLFSQGIEQSLPMLDDAMSTMGDYVYDNMPSPTLDATFNKINSGVGGNGTNVPENEKITQPMIVQVFLGNEMVDEFNVNSDQRVNFITGGRG